MILIGIQQNLNADTYTNRIHVKDFDKALTLCNARLCRVQLELIFDFLIHSFFVIICQK